MKSLITLISCLLVLAIPIHADAFDDATANCLKKQLTQMAWDLDEHNWHFEPDGTAFLLNYSAERYAIGKWTISESANSLILHVQVNGNQYDYQLGGRCGQPELQLISDTESLGELALHQTQTQRTAQTLNTLSGDWQFGFAENSLQYSFALDGKFLSTRRGSEEDELQTGRWTLAGDGHVLLLYTYDGRLQAFNIKYIQLDEMVLSPMMSGQDVAPVSAGDDLFLNKL